MRLTGIAVSDGGAAFVLELARDDDLSLTLYDVSGRRVAALADGPYAAGIHRIPVGEGRGAIALPSGIYFGVARARGSDRNAAAARVMILR
jgi:hypothetical protein